MERLTPDDLNKVCFDTWELCGLDSVCKRDCWKPTPCKIPKIVYRLGHYEDTGLEPQEIAALRADLERVTRERDAAVLDLQIHGGCPTCKFKFKNGLYPCRKFRLDENSAYVRCTGYEWRGTEAT